MKSGIELIADERNRQITVKNRTVQSDVEFNNWKQLSEAASLLCIERYAHLRDNHDVFETDEYGPAVPFKWSVESFQKMMEKPYKQRLIMAGALIAAELDRLNATEE